MMADQNRQSLREPSVLMRTPSKPYVFVQGPTAGPLPDAKFSSNPILNREIQKFNARFQERLKNESERTIEENTEENSEERPKKGNVLKSVSNPKGYENAFLPLTSHSRDQSLTPPRANPYLELSGSAGETKDRLSKQCPKCFAAVPQKVCTKCGAPFEVYNAENVETPPAAPISPRSTQRPGRSPLIARPLSSDYKDMLQSTPEEILKPKVEEQDSSSDPTQQTDKSSKKSSEQTKSEQSEKEIEKDPKPQSPRKNLDPEEAAARALKLAERIQETEKLQNEKLQKKNKQERLKKEEENREKKAKRESPEKLAKGKSTKDPGKPIVPLLTDLPPTLPQEKLESPAINIPSKLNLVPAHPTITSSPVSPRSMLSPRGYTKFISFPSYGVAGQQAKWIIETKGIVDGTLAMSVGFEDGTIIPSYLAPGVGTFDTANLEATNAPYFCSFIPPKRGLYTVTLTQNKKQICEPLSFTVTEPGVELKGPASDVACVGVDFVCAWRLDGVAADLIDVIFTFSRGNALKAKLKPNPNSDSKSSYISSVIPPHTGKALITATSSGGETIKGIPYEFNVLPIPWSKTTVQMAQWGRARELFSFTVETPYYLPQSQIAVEVKSLEEGRRVHCHVGLGSDQKEPAIQVLKRRSDGTGGPISPRPKPIEELAASPRRDDSILEGLALSPRGSKHKPVKRSKTMGVVPDRLESPHNTTPDKKIWNCWWMPERRGEYSIKVLIFGSPKPDHPLILIQIKDEKDLQPIPWETLKPQSSQSDPIIEAADQQKKHPPKEKEGCLIQ